MLKGTKSSGIRYGKSRVVSILFGNIFLDFSKINTFYDFIIRVLYDDHLKMKENK